MNKKGEKAAESVLQTQLIRLELEIREYQDDILRIKQTLKAC